MWHSLLGPGQRGEIRLRHQREPLLRRRYYRHGIEQADGQGGWLGFYYLRDHLGSVLDVADAAGALRVRPVGRAHQALGRRLLANARKNRWRYSTRIPMKRIILLAAWFCSLSNIVPGEEGMRVAKYTRLDAEQLTAKAIELYTSSNKDDRFDAATLVGFFPVIEAPTRAVVLARLLFDEDPDVQSEAIAACHDLRPDQLKPILPLIGLINLKERPVLVEYVTALLKHASSVGLIVPRLELPPSGKGTPGGDGVAGEGDGPTRRNSRGGTLPEFQ